MNTTSESKRMPERQSPIALLTLREAAEMLRRTEAQLRWMVHTGNAPRSAKLGGRRMFREQDVIDWVNAAFENQDAAPKN